MRRYNHVGIPTDVPRTGEVYLERYGVHCTDHESSQFGIQWMRYDPDCPLPDVVKSLPHVAFEVDDLRAELAGREVIIEPNSPSDGVLVAFVLEDGAPVELMQFNESFHATGIAVRLARADDAALLADLGARTFSETFGPDNTEADMCAYLEHSFSPEIQAREIEDPMGRFLICHDGDTALGYARLRLDEAPTCVAGVRPVEIVRFYADTPWIGKGVGAALMSSCLEHAISLGCDVIWLDVWERNPRAIAFYTKWGFTVVGTQDFVLGNDIQHDLLMARSTG